MILGKPVLQGFHSYLDCLVKIQVTLFELPLLCIDASNVIVADGDVFVILLLITKVLIFFIVENTGDLVVTQDGTVIIPAQHGSPCNIKGLNELIGRTIQLDDLFAAGFVLKVVKYIE